MNAKGKPWMNITNSQFQIGANRHIFSPSDRRRLSSGSHAPIFTVVMRSKQPNQQSKQLECHAFICQTPENAIVIAATLYQSLLSHMSDNQPEKQRKPRNQNGVSCVSIASSSVANRYGSSRASVSSNRSKPPSIPLPPPPIPSPRLARLQAQMNSKRMAENSMSSDTDNIVRNALLETSSSSDQRKKRSYKTRRAPPVPPTQNEYLNRGGLSIELFFRQNAKFLNRNSHLQRLIYIKYHRHIECIKWMHKHTDTIINRPIILVAI